MSNARVGAELERDFAFGVGCPFEQVGALRHRRLPSARRRGLVRAGAAALVATAAIALTYAVSALASGTASSASCTAGVKKINGVTVRTFCGTAKGTVKLNGQTIAYKGGECSKSFGLFSLNVGTVVLGNLKNKPEYFGIASESGAGTHTRQTITIVHASKRYGVIGTVTLKAGLRAGTFSGKVFGASQRISGSPTC